MACHTDAVFCDCYRPALCDTCHSRVHIQPWIVATCRQGTAPVPIPPSFPFRFKSNLHLEWWKYAESRHKLLHMWLFWICWHQSSHYRVAHPLGGCNCPCTNPLVFVFVGYIQVIGEQWTVQSNWELGQTASHNIHQHPIKPDLVALCRCTTVVLDAIKPVYTNMLFLPYGLLTSEVYNLHLDTSTKRNYIRFKVNYLILVWYNNCGFTL